MFLQPMVMRLSLLYILQLGLAMEFEVIYKIFSPNCGYVDASTALTTAIDLYPFGLKLDNSSSTFSVFVKGHGDIIIFAMDETSGQNAGKAYLFYIGGGSNTWCGVKDTRKNTMRNTINGSFANRTRYMPFWFSWENGHIRYGQGETEDVNTMVTWIDPQPFEVQGIAISTCYGETAEWKVNIKVRSEFSGYFNKCGMSNTRSEIPIIDSITTSKIACAGKCSTIDSCFGFNYNSNQKRCELLSMGARPIDNIMRTNAQGWDFYTKCFDGKDVCVGCFF